MKSFLIILLCIKAVSPSLILSGLMLQYIGRQILAGIPDDPVVNVNNTENNLVSKLAQLIDVQTLWPELCPSCNKRGKKKFLSDSSEEHVADEEDYSKYIIKAKNEATEQAEQELMEEDPQFFHFVLKDRHKRWKKKKTIKENPLKRKRLEGNSYSERVDFKPMQSPPPQKFKGNIPPSMQMSSFRPGSLPLFIRYRKPSRRSRILFRFSPIIG